MRQRRIICLWLVSLLTVFVAVTGGSVSNAEQLEPDREIDHLLTFIQASDCSFIRNGKSHTSEEAVEHIRGKYNYLKKRISSAEQFIDLAASRSSISGKEYLVRCGDTSLSAKVWLNRELLTFRQQQHQP